MDPMIEQLISQLIDAWEHAKWFGVLGVALLFSVRIFRLDFVQKLVPGKVAWLRWGNWHQLAKWGVPILLSAGGAVAWKYGAGISLSAAIASAVTMIVTSVGAHEATKAVGDIEGAAKLNKDPSYRPGKLRRAVSLAIPVSRSVDKAGLEPPA